MKLYILIWHMISLSFFDVSSFSRFSALNSNHRLRFAALNTSTKGNIINGIIYNDAISSSKSNTVKKIRALLSKRKKRNEFGQTVVEGPKMVFDLLSNTQTKPLVDQVLIAANNKYDIRDDYIERLRSVRTMDRNFVQLVDPNVFYKLCTDTMTPQGIVAIVNIPNIQTAISNHKVAIRNGKDHNDDTVPRPPMYLILDGVSDPGNMGTLLRSSVAVDIAGVILLPGCCDVWNPKAIRSAMTASFMVPIIESTSWTDTLSFLHSKGIKTVYGATMIEGEGGDGESYRSVPYYEVDWLGRCGLVVGAEGKGLSSDVRSNFYRGTASQQRGQNIGVAATHIPMVSHIESLNAAVCGSVILFEYSRQCIESQTESSEGTHSY